MQAIKWSALALAVTAATSQLAMASAQSESKGFVEDSSLNVLSRTLYFNRDFRNGNPRAPQEGRIEEFGQGFIGTFESGFTQGTVGVGVDVIGLAGIKLDTGRGRNNDDENSGLFATHDNGRSENSYGEMGAAVKARISNTVIKYGTQFVELPVFSIDDSRLLPETATGTLITSNEIEGLELHAGRFTALNAQARTGRDSQGTKSVNLIGGSYAFNDDLSASLYWADTEDAFEKHYANLNYTLGLAEKQSLNFDFNIYHTQYDKKYVRDAYDIDSGKNASNTLWSLATAYNIQAHTLTLAFQQSKGGIKGLDSKGDWSTAGYDYGVDGNGTLWTANSIQRSDFNGKDERSWQLRYDLDFADYGVPGLAFMTRYVRGTGIDFDDGKDLGEWERNVQLTYTLQEGAAKDLMFRVRQATYRADAGYQGGKVDEVRLIVEYPLSIL